MSFLKYFKIVVDAALGVNKPRVPQTFVVKIDRSSIEKNPDKRKMPGEIISYVPGLLLDDGKGGTHRNVTPVYSIGGWDPPMYLYNMLPCEVTCSHCGAKFSRKELFDEGSWIEETETWEYMVCCKCLKPNCCMLEVEELSSEMIEEAEERFKAEFALLSRIVEVYSKLHEPRLPTRLQALAHIKKMIEKELTE